MRSPLILLGLAALAVPVIAQMPTTPPGKPDPKLVQAGTYKVETNHTQVSFGVDHLGFTPYFGTFSGATGTLVLDPAKPAAASLEVTIPIASVQTTSAKLTEELISADWFDAAKFPTATFRSTRIIPNGNEARIEGNLTLHGVTRPVTLDARFYGAGTTRNTLTIGFEGKAQIKRSDFGVSKGVPLVSDGVGLMITAAFEKAG